MLDPTGGGRSCGPREFEDPKGTVVKSGGCPACNACKPHAKNKLFSSAEAADARRAHKGCLCTVVDGPVLASEVFDSVFVDSDSCDRRDPRVAAILTGGTVDPVPVPMIAGIAVPVVLVAAGGIGYAIWRRNQRRLDAATVTASVESTDRADRSDEPRVRVLAVGAHPDDVELGCGGTLLRHHERRDEITVLVMTGGERGVYDARSRRNEQQYAAALTGATLIWGGFADGAVPPGPEAIAVVDRAVARSGAEILYTHAPDDSHQDHIATSSVCLAAARRVPTVLYYETPSTLEFMPTVFIDLDDVMDRKIGLVRAHLSQVLRNGPVDLDALVAQARFRGSQSRTQHAEAFRPARFLWDLVSAPEHVPARAAEPEPARIDRAAELRAISEVAGSLSR